MHIRCGTRRFALSCLALLAGAALQALGAEGGNQGEYANQFNYGQAKGKGSDWVKSIQVLKPEYRGRIKDAVTVVFTAPGMDDAEARCWHQPDAEHPGEWGYDAVVMEPRKITGQKEVSFEFPAGAFPNGPLTIRIAAKNDKGKRDLCELQLFNEGGVKWNQGLPAATPPGAEGLKLIFADDFDKMPSISRMGVGTTYMGHKPPNGSQDFSGYRFSHKDDYEGAHDPFEQEGSWLRIKARAPGKDKKNWGTGIIAPTNVEHEGVWAYPPFYMECRFVAQSAPGTWPAFWTLTKGGPGGADELDIIEGYGGLGPGNPNDEIGYHIVSHFWGQKGPDGKNKKGFHRRVPILELGGKSWWSTTFHTYGVRVDQKETVYYFDNIEVLRHPTNDISATQPAYFLINYAIGGISGWKIDLARYGNATDMWVDFVRVYSAKLPAPIIAPKGAYVFDTPLALTITSPSPGATLHYTTDGSDPTAQSPAYKDAVPVNKPCMIKAIAIRDGMESSVVSAVEVKAPLPAQTVANAQPGLLCEYYEGSWKKLPDFTTLTPKTSAVTAVPELPKERAQDNFGCRFTGYIEAPAAGLYTFFTNSDDGSRLLIDGQSVVENDGAHGELERKGEIGLAAGKHRIEIQYFENIHGEMLQVFWQCPGAEKQPLPAEKLSHEAK